MKYLRSWPICFNVLFFIRIISLKRKHKTNLKNDVIRRFSFRVEFFFIVSTLYLDNFCSSCWKAFRKCLRLWVGVYLIYMDILTATKDNNWDIILVRLIVKRVPGNPLPKSKIFKKYCPIKNKSEDKLMHNLIIFHQWSKIKRILISESVKTLTHRQKHIDRRSFAWQVHAWLFSLRCRYLLCKHNVIPLSSAAAFMRKKHATLQRRYITSRYNRGTHVTAQCNLNKLYTTKL